jgi:hypothetical protein
MGEAVEFIKLLEFVLDWRYLTVMRFHVGLERIPGGMLWNDLHDISHLIFYLLEQSSSSNNYLDLIALELT